MIKIYADQIKKKGIFYIEDEFSSYEITKMSKEAFRYMIEMCIGKGAEIHTCYDTFINHIGRFVREYGKTWYGEEFVIITREDHEHYFKNNGQLKEWPHGYFG